MPKKKKKKGGANGPTTTIFVEQESPAPPAELLSLRLVQSASASSKSLKYSPTIYMNDIDADSLDLISGDEVFLISNIGSSKGLIEEMQASVAKVNVNVNSQVNSSVGSPMKSKRQNHNKLTPGNCHVYPVSLANSFIGKDNKSENPVSTPQTPTPRTPMAKTPVTTSTPSSSNSKFSFSKGGGGDVLISSPSILPSTPSGSTPANRQQVRHLWVVPRHSDLGGRVSSILCREAKNIRIDEIGGGSPTQLNRCNGPLGKKVLLAHIIDSYIGKGTNFRFSFQGQFIDCTTSNIRGRLSFIDNVAQNFAELSISDNSDEEMSLMKPLRSLSERQLEKLQLYLITKDTIVNIGEGITQEKNEKDDRPIKFVEGLNATLKEVNTILSTPLLHPELFSGHLRPPRGVLLHGPSGSGKSSLALQLSATFKSEVYVENVNCAMLQSQTALVGQAERQLVELFESAQKPRPGKLGSLVVLDDVHLICPHREGTNLGADRLSATLLALLDGVELSSSSYPLMILAITSNPALLDPALRRPGRLDYEVEVPLPDEPSTRSTILQFHVESLKAKSFLSQAEWLSLARIAKGFTGADLKLAVKEALRNTALKHIESVDIENIEIKLDEMESAIRATKPSAIKAVTVEIPSVYWESIGGMENVKRQLREAIELPMTHSHMFQKLGIRPPRGVLLYGPPGCSKTLMARALATEGNMNFLAVKGPELLSKWLGESERALASLFRRARLASPSIIFFDEVDAIASKRSGNSSGGERLLSQLLTELDGIHSKDDAAKKRRVVIVCATNRPDLLDDALMRPGRIDQMIYVGIPDETSRHCILEISLQGKSCADDIDVSLLLLYFRMQKRVIF
jgi:SpoVK/Ycf46/Vps4 family AAA+-type ATPase